MFTGLVETVGRVVRIDRVPDDGGAAAHLGVATGLGEALEVGESVAVNGVCLTVAHRDATGFEAMVSPQTLRVTSLGGLTTGRAVNLERAVRANARLGGHFVLGHVDGVGRIAGVTGEGDSRWLEVDVPEELLPGLVDKGSIAIDGISLTIAGLAGRRVGVQVVPHTLAQTALGGIAAGDAVNIETDIIGKYVARLMGLRAAAAREDA